MEFGRNFEHKKLVYLGSYLEHWLNNKRVSMVAVGVR